MVTEKNSLWTMKNESTRRTAKVKFKVSKMILVYSYSCINIEEFYMDFKTTAQDHSSNHCTRSLKLLQ